MNRIPLERHYAMCFMQSMHAKSLVPILAEIYGVPQEAAFIIDRSLSEAGLREKARGKRHPDMTRREALIFLIACMTTERATRAGEEVVRWIEARGLLIEPRRAEDDEDDDRAFPLRAFAHKHLSPLVSRFADQSARMPTISLIDFLLVACHLLENGMFQMFQVKLAFELAHDGVEFSISDGFIGQVETYHFTTDNADRTPDEIKGIHRCAFIHGEALFELIGRTVDPLTEV